jgi:hypothetical protein
MDDASMVGTRKPTRDLYGDAHGLGCREWSPFEATLQRLAVTVGHREEDPPIGHLLDVVDRANVGVIQRGRRAGLGEQAPLGVQIAHQLRRQEFESDEPAKPKVFGPVDDAHTAGANLVDNAIVGDRLADHEAPRRQM